MCARCRDRVAQQKLIAADDQNDPFSFFPREEQLHEGDSVVPATPAPPVRPRATSRAPVPARSLILAFSLGLAAGAAPFLSQDLLRGTPASAEPARDNRTEATPVEKPTPVIATVLPPPAAPSSPVRMTDIALPGSPEPENVAAAAPAAPPPARRRAPAITTIRYPERRPATFRGSLAVTTTPAGARVLINGTPIGSTPLQIVGVPAGSHVLRLEAEGRRASASAIQVVADRLTRVTRELEPSP